MKWYLVCLAAFAALSLVAFALYGADKHRARRGAWRIPEKVLLGFSFFGGAAGSLLGMLAFRHKTRHWYFHAVNLLGIAWQVALLVFLFVR